MNKLLIIGFIVVLIVGIIIGIVGDNWCKEHKFSRRHPPKPHGVMEFKNFMQNTMKDRLKLNDEQMKKNEPLLTETHSKIQMIDKNFHDQMKKLIDEYFASLKKDLNPEMQKKLEKIRMEMGEKKFSLWDSYQGKPFLPCDDRMGFLTDQNPSEFKDREMAKTSEKKAPVPPVKDQLL